VALNEEPLTALTMTKSRKAKQVGKKLQPSIRELLLCLETRSGKWIANCRRNVLVHVILRPLKQPPVRRGTTTLALAVRTLMPVSRASVKVESTTIFFHYVLAA
jgi:hypothetical protein